MFQCNSTDEAPRFIVDLTTARYRTARGELVVHSGIQFRFIFPADLDAQ